MKAFYVLFGKISNFDLTLFDLASSKAIASLTRAVPSPIGLFSVVQFPNDACDTTDATPLTGTCLTSTECTGRSVLTSQGVIILYIVLQLQSFRLPPDRNSTIVANLAASSLLFCV